VISVLIPSRGRPFGLEQSFRSLVDLAAQPGRVEILVAVDPDDPDTRQMADSLGEVECGISGRDPIGLWMAPERFGYAGLERYYNHLAGMASGEWLLIFNDDCRMLTPGWDEIIHAQQPAALWLAANHAPGGNFFPAFPRSWADAWGHVALVANIDVWIQEVATRAGLHRKIPVEVFHDRFDVTGNAANDDATYREGRAVMGLYSNHPDYDSPANREARIRDAITIRRLAEGRP
jgi:hypothetical protein